MYLIPENTLIKDFSINETADYYAADLEFAKEFSKFLTDLEPELVLASRMKDNMDSSMLEFWFDDNFAYPISDVTPDMRDYYDTVGRGEYSETTIYSMEIQEHLRGKNVDYIIITPHQLPFGFDHQWIGDVNDGQALLEFFQKINDNI